MSTDEGVMVDGLTAVVWKREGRRVTFHFEPLTDEGFVRCEYTCESGYMCTLRAGHTTNHTSEGAT